MAEVTKATIGELIDSNLNLAFDYVRNIRSCPGLDDQDLARLGICRVLGSYESGRDWLQFIGDRGLAEVPRSTFFDALHSPRRLSMLQELEAALEQLAARQIREAGIDWLAEFPELDGCEVFAADGHVIAHASHAQKDAKDRNVPVGTVYGLDLRTGLSRVLTHVSGDGRRRHEMPSFREALRKRGQSAPTVWVLDRAYHDKAFWSQMWRDRGVVMITRMKANMRPVHRCPLPVDREDPVNSGVTGHYLIGLEGAYGSMFEVTYTDPETGEDFAFLSSAEFPRPGMVAWLYFLRWRIEKLYDTFKNRLGETKAWATGANAAQCQASLITMTHNFLRLLEALLSHQCGVSDAKVARKYDDQLNRRECLARKQKRGIHPLLRYPRMPQLSAQFIRVVRNHLFCSKPIAAILALFTAALGAYL